MKLLYTFLISGLTYSASAQLGIGTTSPTSPLDIETNTTTTYLDINNTAADGDPAINFQLSGTTTFTIGVNDGEADEFRIGTSDLEDAQTRFGIDASGNIAIGTVTYTALLNVDGSAIFNESHAAVDFRVEGDTEANLLFVDGSADKVGIGTSSPANTLDIEGDLILQSGTNINEFSIDGTMAGNSDDALPTEKAVVTYVAAEKVSLTKTITIEAPTSSDYFPLFRTDVAITITEAISMLNAAGDVDVRIYWDTDYAETSPTAVGTATTLTTTSEASVSIASDATIPANSWIFIDIPESTTPQTVCMNIRYTED
jgi:hypothetical protein